MAITPNNLQRRTVPRRVHRPEVPQGLPPVTDATLTSREAHRRYLQANNDQVEQFRQVLGSLLNLSETELERLQAHLVGVAKGRV
ncbi:MAG: hypothetical protein KDI44_17830 [Thiothrix sp.]|nr:hypothetical protein [Thiothrix sp.]HPQ94597.1 hypothetical protein [Thiolinea sp.]